MEASSCDHPPTWYATVPDGRYADVPSRHKTEVRGKRDNGDDSEQPANRTTPGTASGCSTALGRVDRRDRLPRTPRWPTSCAVPAPRGGRSTSTSPARKSASIALLDRGERGDDPRHHRGRRPEGAVAGQVRQAIEAWIGCAESAAGDHGELDPRRTRARRRRRARCSGTLMDAFVRMVAGAVRHRRWRAAVPARCRGSSR